MFFAGLLVVTSVSVSGVLRIIAPTLRMEIRGGADRIPSKLIGALADGRAVVAAIRCEAMP